MLNLLYFVGALALTVAVFELANGLLTPTLAGRSRLSGGVTVNNVPGNTRRNTWEALLIVIFPNRFDAAGASSMNVVDLLRRAGYPYDTPGDFYAAAIRDFTMYLVLGGVLAGVVALAGNPLAGVPIAAAFIYVGLSRPYTRLKVAAKKRAEATRNNMLVGISELDALLSAGMSTQEALRRTSTVGGPFCNLLALLVSRMEIESIDKAVETTRNHLPDPRDVEANLFLRDVQDFYENNRPLAGSVSALRKSLHRQIVEATEAKASMVRQNSGMFGVLALIGMTLSLVGPFMAIF